jgi:hypothetical protein
VGIALPTAAEIYHPNAAVGDVPDQWNAIVSWMSCVLWYSNDSFGIVADGTLDIRKQKVRDWLTGEWV